jgi:circadian clock protein KaiC
VATAQGEQPDATLLTGIPNLDRVLGGGIPRKATVMVLGAPGTGKTILAQQLAFALAERGERILYLTGYSETHDKLIAHSQSLSFFVPARIGAEIQLLNLLELLQDGRDATEEAIVSEARRQRVSLVVLDGFRGMRRFFPDDLQVAHFLYTLGAKLALLGTTTLVIVEGDADDAAHFPELTVCDVILSLHRPRLGNRFRRVLDVRKLRGAEALDGPHAFAITREGITIYPRFEALRDTTAPGWTSGRASIGVPAIDALLGGGLTVGTMTLVAGSPGLGKTLLGLHFAAAGARLGEPTLVLSFVENAAQLRERSAAFGLGLAAAETAGTVRFLSQPAYDLDADRIAQLLREDIEQRGVRRLVINSAVELDRAIAAPERQADFLAALVAYLRERQVTSYVTLDMDTIVGPTLQLSAVPLSLVAENLLILRYAEYEGTLQRLLAVLKMRYSAHDTALQTYRIEDRHGFVLQGAVPAASGLLTGIAQANLTTPRASGDVER